MTAPRAVRSPGAVVRSPGAGVRSPGAVVRSPGASAPGPTWAEAHVLRVLFAICGFVIWASTPAQAQPRVEMTVGAVANGPSSAGTTRATLTNPSGAPLVLFQAEHRTRPSLGLEGGVAVRLLPGWMVELSGAWSRPTLETRVFDDFEGADPVTLVSGTQRFTVLLGAVRQFDRRGRLVPYARVEAGWLRELTSDRALAENGVAAHAGAGLKYWVREAQSGWLSHVAFRAEGRLAMRRGGLTLGDAGTRWSPALSAGLVIAR